MVLQAAGLAILAALSPTALLVAAIYLGTDRPRLTAAFYLIGAVVMTVAVGAIALVVLRNAQLSLPADRSPRYGLRLGLGVVLLLVGLVIATRPSREQDSRGTSGILSRMTAEPGPRSAFLVGMLIFAPFGAFLAAIQVIATARAGVELTVVAILTVVVINALLVWLPILLHVFAPQFTTRRLVAFDGWLKLHSKALLVSVLVVVGVIMCANGIYGLTR